MITEQTQIKINLPLALKEFVESKANRYGLPIAAYLKHLILKDMEGMEYPTFELSERSEKAYKEAMKNRSKAIRVKGDIKTFLDNL